MTEFIATGEQDQAISYPDTPLRVIAGAGTGKTTVMVERIGHLVATGRGRPDQVLGLTFTNKAAAELKQRVDARLGPDADVLVTTYHGFGSGLVAGHLLQLDLHPRTRLLDRAEAWQLLFRVFDEFRFAQKRVFRPGTVVNDALALASHCADHLVAIEAVAADAEVMATGARWKASRAAAQGRLELCQIVAAYDREKRRRHLIDFGDQIRLAVTLLRENPHVAALVGCQRRFVLLDEYQDTNYAQRVLLQLIYPAGSAITAVGDDMQSIYGFRGAHLRNILDFSHHFPPAGELALTENRRSGPAIVALANRIQDQVSESVPKQLTAPAGAGSAVVECFLAADDVEEAALIAADIAALGPPWTEHAVLCRKRRLIPAIALALEGRGLPVEVVGSSGLLDRPEVVDLMAWLELLADPMASVALLRILAGPRYRLGRRDLAALARHVSRLCHAAADAGEHSDLDPAALADAVADHDGVADLSSRARARLRQLIGVWDDLSRAAQRLPLIELAEVVVARTGLWGAVGPRGQENLLRFLNIAQGFAPVEGIPGLAAFIEYVHLLDESEEDVAEAHPGARAAIVVSTIHQAKGLEWDHVWVPGLAGSGRSRIFPDDRGGDNPLSKQTALPWWLCQDDPGFGDWRTSSKDALDRAIRRRAGEEEWRLLYVACTRARRRLVCSAAQWYPGPTAPQGPSEFYTFISGQRDLVTERFRHDPPATDPQVSQMRAREAAIVNPRPAPAIAAAAQPTLFDEPVPVVAAPGTISVTDLVSVRRCPRQYYWLAVRPLPRRPSPAARLGVEAHRWIEQWANGQRDLGGVLEADGESGEADPGGGPDLDGEPIPSNGGPGAPDPAAGLKAAFLATPYAELRPRRAEAPFVLAVDGRLVRGRVDAIYQRGDRIDVVDFKTGRPPLPDDPGAPVEIASYAVAAADVWSEDPSTLRTTYCYLRADGTFVLVEQDWTADALTAARQELSAAVGLLADEAYPAHTGDWCRRCEWRAVCPSGLAFLDPRRAEGAKD